MYRAAFKYVPQPEATTFAFPSVFTLLLCLGNTGYPVQGLNLCLLMQTLIVIVCIHKPPGYNIVNSVSGRTCRRGISPLPSLPRRGTAPRHLVPSIPGRTLFLFPPGELVWATIRPSADPSSWSHAVSWFGKLAANRLSGLWPPCPSPFSFCNLQSIYLCSLSLLRIPRQGAERPSVMVAECR